MMTKHKTKEESGWCSVERNTKIEKSPGRQNEKKSEKAQNGESPSIANDSLNLLYLFHSC